MAELNPLIPMSVKPLEIGNALLEGQSFAQNKRLNDQRIAESETRQGVLEQRSQTEQQAAAIAAENHNIRSVATASLGLQPLIQSGDWDGVVSNLEQRAKMIQKAGGDPTETLEGIELIKSGNTDEFTQYADFAVREAFNRGLLQTQQTEYGRVIKGVKPDGTPAFFRVGSDNSTVEIEGFTPAEDKPFGEIVTPDGTTITLGGSGGGSNKSDGRRVEALEVLSTERDRLAEIRNNYDPALFTLPGRLQAGITSLKSLAGVKDISPEDKAQAERAIRARSTLAENQSLVINRLSGAAVSPSEAKRLGGFVVGPNDSPIEIESKLKQLERSTDLAMMRMNWLRFNDRKVDKGAFQEFPLESIEQIARDRRDELRKQFHNEQPEMTGEQVKQLVRAQLKIEFGI